MIDHSSPRWFSTGVPVRASRRDAFSADRFGLLRLGVLHVLGLVEDDSGPLPLRGPPGHGPPASSSL